MKTGNSQHQSISGKYMDQYKDEIKSTAFSGQRIPDNVTQKIDNDKKVSEASIKDKYDGLITNLLNDGNVITREKQNEGWTSFGSNVFGLRVDQNFKFQI